MEAFVFGEEDSRLQPVSSLALRRRQLFVRKCAHSVETLLAVPATSCQAGKATPEDKAGWFRFAGSCETLVRLLFEVFLAFFF